MQDLSIDPQRGTVQSIPLFLLLFGLVAVPHWLLWHENIVSAALDPLGLLGILGILAAGVILHEGVHGITWMLTARLKPADMKYGVLWKALTPYAHPKVPIPARAYRLGAAMPGILLGLIPALAGLATGSGFVSGWGAVFLAAAAGDLLILLKIRSVPADALVRDHPSRFGCEVLDPEEADRGFPPGAGGNTPVAPAAR